MRPLLLMLLSLSPLVAAACGDDPFDAQWAPAPDTALLYSLARPEVNLPSGFSFSPGTRGPVVIEAPGSTGVWDLALDTQGGQLVFLPPRALGINSRARVTALPGLTFAEVEEAPGDTSVYVMDRPLPVASGTTYVVQTSPGVGGFGQSCVYYAKLEPLVIDVALGTLEFLYDSSPICNDLRLVPSNGD